MYIAGVLKTIKFKSSDEIHFILIFGTSFKIYLGEKL